MNTIFLLLSDSEASANAVLSIIQLLSNADLDIKLAATRKVKQMRKK